MFLISSLPWIFGDSYYFYFYYYYAKLLSAKTCSLLIELSSSSEGNSYFIELGSINDLSL